MTAPRGRMSDTLSEYAQIGPRVAAQAGEDKLARPRVAVVLAAGRSERLADVTGGGSKALVRASAASAWLLARYGACLRQGSSV